jgi:nucleoside permease NupC
MNAFLEGESQGVKMAVGIAMVLIIVLVLEALFDLILGKPPELHGQPLSAIRLLGWITLSPFLYCLS